MYRIPPSKQRLRNFFTLTESANLKLLKKTWFSSYMRNIFQLPFNISTRVPPDSICLILSSLRYLILSEEYQYIINPVPYAKQPNVSRRQKPSKSEYLYVTYFHVWCVFSLSLTRSVSHGYSLLFILTYTSGIWLFTDFFLNTEN